MDLYNESPGLSIGELSARTGIGVSTLRAWEARHGFPVPRRLPGGHRRYTEADARALAEVARERRNGSSLGAALARARARLRAPRSSVMAALRRAAPDLAPGALSTSTLLTISRAVEDEAAARAERPLLVGGFQEARFWARARTRWEDLAHTSAVTVALHARADGPAADPRAGDERAGDPRAPSPTAGDPPAGAASLWEVPVPASAPVSREWVLICDSPTLAVCLAGTERPGERAVGRARRRFDALLTVEPGVVREAARTAVAIALEYAPGLDPAVQSILAHPAPATVDTARGGAALMNRVIGYLDAERSSGAGVGPSRPGPPRGGRGGRAPRRPGAPSDEPA